MTLLRIKQDGSINYKKNTLDVLTILQELKRRLYFEDSSDTNCVTIILLFYFLCLFYKSQITTTDIFMIWHLHKKYINRYVKLNCFILVF